MVIAFVYIMHCRTTEWGITVVSPVGWTQVIHLYYIPVRAETVREYHSGLIMLIGAMQR